MITTRLDACGYQTIIDLRVLQDKALITIFDNGSEKGIVCMHDLIRAMGHEIVRKKSPKDLGRCCHLWDVDDIYKVFNNKLGTETIESIRFQTWKLERKVLLEPQTFASMKNIRLLEFINFLGSKMLYPPEEGFESLPNELRCLGWQHYPLKSFPLRCRVDNLVMLDFSFSQLLRLWDGVQDLPSLKVLELSYSPRFIQLPNLSKAPNLERINLIRCVSFSHVGLWPKHNMTGQDPCAEPKKPTSLSSSLQYYVFPSLKFLSLGECLRLTELPKNMGHYFPSLETLDLKGTKVITLPASIRHISKLTSLDVSKCSVLRHIPELPPSIKHFDAAFCLGLGTLQFTWYPMPLSLQKHRLEIQLENCIKLDACQLEAVATHYKLTTKRIISESTKDGYALLCMPGSKVPKCFSRYKATQDPVFVPIELPLQFRALGFIFYFLFPPSLFAKNFTIKCYIKLSNVPEVQFTCDDPKGLLRAKSRVVLFWYGSSLSLKIMEEVSRIKALSATCEPYAKVWFKPFYPKGCNVKEWAVYPILINTERCLDTNDSKNGKNGDSKPLDLINIKGCTDVNDSDDDNDNDNNDDGDGGPKKIDETTSAP